MRTKPKWEEGKNFYELMQIYRHTSITKQKEITIAYENIKQFIKQTLKAQEENFEKVLRDYQYGFIRDDGFGNPERAPEWQVIEDCIKYVEGMMK